MTTPLWMATMVLLSLGGKQDDLAGAANKLGKADNYAFTIDAQPGAGTGGAFEGKYQPGAPVYFKADNIEFYRKGHALVYNRGNGWQKSKTGVESDPLIVLGGAAKARSARLPHEELAELAKVAKNVKRGQAKDSPTYTAELTPEAAKKLASTEWQSVARGGKASIWTDANGTPTKFELKIRLQGRLGNADVDGESVKVVTLRDVGSSRVQVPDEAMKLLP